MFVHLNANLIFMKTKLNFIKWKKREVESDDKQHQNPMPIIFLPNKQTKIPDSDGKLN